MLDALKVEQRAQPEKLYIHLYGTTAYNFKHFLISSTRDEILAVSTTKRIQGVTLALGEAYIIPIYPIITDRSGIKPVSNKFQIDKLQQELITRSLILSFFNQHNELVTLVIPPKAPTLNILKISPDGRSQNQTRSTSTFVLKMVPWDVYYSLVRL